MHQYSINSTACQNRKRLTNVRNRTIMCRYDFVHGGNGMKQREEFIHRINYLTSEMDAVYHRASLKLGISDSVSLILYTIYDAGGSCLLSEIYKKSGISKQTVNSALRGLEGKASSRSSSTRGAPRRSCLPKRGVNMPRRRRAGSLRPKCALWTRGRRRRSTSISA